MRNEYNFTASSPAVAAVGAVGGSGAVANPAAGGATALMVENHSSSQALLRFAPDASYAPQRLDPELADLILNPGGRHLVQNPAQLAAPFIVIAGSVSLIPGATATAITINS